jgi:hypothetical protein
MGFFGGGGSAGGIGGSTGATDNAILRADGTGAATLQNSAIIIDDSIVSFSCTGVASTDVITAVGHNFTTNQGVRFLTITGGGSVFAGVNYFVRDISGDTFKLSLTSGGSVRDITSDITAGSIVAMEPNVALRNNNSETNASTVFGVKGNGSFILGAKPDGTATGGNPRGTNAADFQISRFTETQVASGNYSFVAGRGNTASNNHAAALGTGNTSSGAAAFCAGIDNTASQVASVALGQNNTSSAAYAFGYGLNALADRHAIFASTGDRFSANGDSQRIMSVLRAKTTTNSAVELFISGSTRLTVPSGKVMAMTISITGVKSDGSAVAHYMRQYCIKNVAGTTSEVYAPVTIGADNAAGTSISITANDTNDALNISATGIDSETWRWVASVDAVEVAYGT